MVCYAVNNLSSPEERYLFQDIRKTTYKLKNIVGWSFKQYFCDKNRIYGKMSLHNSIFQECCQVYSANRYFRYVERRI